MSSPPVLSPHPRDADKPLLLALAALVVLPLFAILPGFAAGKVAFVLYREPKLAAIGMLGWAFLALFAARHAGRLSPVLLGSLLRRPVLLALAAFLAYFTATLFWVEVVPNHLYELRQYCLLALVWVALLAWSSWDRRVPRVITATLVASLGTATLVGWFQRFWPLALLPPIDPQMGVANPSVMGYKNPMALALLGQIFVLARLVFEPTRLALRWRAALGALLALELGYLAMLQSRTCYAALLVGLVFLAALRLLRHRSWRAAGRTAALAALAVMLLALAAAASPAIRARVGSALGYLADPASFLESDRGTYLLNTLEMVHEHPFGVGLGDWQTHYPLYRRHRPEVSFDESFQVRRAHSDHVQLLGEGGWPGLALWAVWLAILIGSCVRTFLRSGHSRALYHAAQLVTLTAAMASDYVLELPYLKLELFLVVFLATETDGCEPENRRLGRAPASIVAVLIAFAATLHGLFFAGQIHKVYLGAAATHQFLTAVGGVDDFGHPRRPTADPERLLRCAELGRRMLLRPGHAKTVYRDYVTVAQAELLLGRRGPARSWALRALELHPHDPAALRLMAMLEDDPVEAARWRAAHEQILRGGGPGSE